MPISLFVPYGQEKFGTKTELKTSTPSQTFVRVLNTKFNARLKFFAQVVKFAKKHAVTMKLTRQPSSCVSRKVLQTTATSQNQTYLSLKFQTSGSEEMRTELPEFPKERLARYVADLGLSDYDASQLTANKVTSDFFEKSCGSRW